MIILPDESATTPKVTAADGEYAAGLAMIAAYVTAYPGKGREEEEIQYMQAAILAALLRKFDSR